MSILLTKKAMLYFTSKDALKALLKFPCFLVQSREIIGLCKFLVVNRYRALKWNEIRDVIAHEF